MLKAALEYAGAGWPVFPVKPRGKTPLTQRGFKDATTDRAQLERLWSEHPDANIGVPTGAVSGFVVLDVDGPEAEQALQELGASSPTRTSITGRGRHILMKHPGEPVRNRTGLRPSLDVRGDGGYIILPPSVHPDGHRYAWDDEHGMGWGLALAPLPEKLRAELTGGNGKEPAPALPHVIAEGTRNATLTSLAGSMRRRGASQASILAALTAENTARCRPPLPETEVETITASIARYNPAPTELHTHELNESDVVTPGVIGTSFVSSSNSCTTPSYDSWPAPLAAAAYHGLTGELLQAVTEETEADPAAILATFLVVAGSFFGRAPHCRVGGDWHHTNENLLLVGATSEGRKGSSFGEAVRPFRLAFPDKMGERVRSGLSSGEGLIWAVRDPIEEERPVKERGHKTGMYETVIVDQGVQDKRLVVLETEFASTLKIMGREGNSLSAVIRQAWETGSLSTLTKNTPSRATGAHISIVGHCTAEELRRNLNRTEIAAGFMNRFLIICARRARLLPDGGNLLDADLNPLVIRLQKILIRGYEHSEVLRRDEGATALWHEVYERLTRVRPGLMGAITSRATAHVLRLSLIYAMLDLADQVRRPHLEAALAVWCYARDSAAFVFGEALGDTVAETLLRTLREAEDGLTLTALHGALGRNYSGERINCALKTLEGAGLAWNTTTKTRGRPAHVWRAAR